MAVDAPLAAHHVIDEEARAEVDVLNTRLEQTTQLTRKIQACLGRLEASSQRQLGSNVDAVLAAIDRLRQPADSKDDEQHVIRAGPEKAGLQNYLSSLKRLNKSTSDMLTSNLRANQHTINDLSHLIEDGNAKLFDHFTRLLKTGTPHSIEPLHYVTKDKPFPVLQEDTLTQLGLIYEHLKPIFIRIFSQFGRGKRFHREEKERRSRVSPRHQWHEHICQGLGGTPSVRI
ncbi:Exocyst complex protein EXO70 [Ophiocordyceps camponoti-floridani]|uniref:Exocyst complex protein EXO70 n=1 Tax=Ophiocordyceps camponoti-floridani TaxID=2030778 RepID=A0A8H4Q3Q4_9HYPO|nr:Exocyst complex protein EXO70 [Ophiocordyceps camponoti-floridani]